MKYFSWRDTVQNVDVAILLNPLHPKINMHNIHTVHYTFQGCALRKISGSPSGSQAF